MLSSFSSYGNWNSETQILLYQGKQLELYSWNFLISKPVAFLWSHIAISRATWTHATRIGIIISISQIRSPRPKVNFTQWKSSLACVSSGRFGCYTHHFFAVISTVLKNIQTICNPLSFLCLWLCANGKCKFFAIYSRFYISGSVPIVSLSRFVLNIYY